MTEFKSHSNTAFTAVNAYVRPEKEEDDSTTYADKIVFETEDMGEITFKPRDTEEVVKQVDGMPTKDSVEVMYPIKYLPDAIKDLVNKVNDADGLTCTATIGEAIQEGGASSYFISKNNFSTIDTKQETIFDDEEKTAEEFAEKEVNA